MGDAAADELVPGVLVEVDGGVETPTLGAGARVQRNDLVEGGAEDEGVVHEDRGALSGRLTHVVRARDHVAGVVLPDRGEAGYVGCGDLVCAAVAVAARIAAVVGPVVAHVDGGWRAGRFGGCAGDVETVCSGEAPDHGAAEDGDEGCGGEEGCGGPQGFAGGEHR